MFTIAEIVKATKGKLMTGKAALRVKGVSTDTRTIKPSQLFIALKGGNFDGHRFLVDAVKAGATVVLVSEAPAEDIGAAVIVVRDTLVALGDLASFHRGRFKIPLVAITGSAGKTTTKEFIAQVLQEKYKTLYNKGTENNHVGVPMSLLKLDKTYKAAVVELGTNSAGEIARLAQITRPTIAVFTNIGESHLAGLRSPLGVYEEKAFLIDHLDPKGTIVFNADDPFLRQLRKKKRSQKVVTYGIDHKADIMVSDVRTKGKGLELVLAPKKILTLTTPVWGNVYNALAAVAVGEILRIPFAKVRRAIQKTAPQKGRQCFHEVSGITIIDDTYNANPVSYRNGLRTLSLFPRKGRSFLVAADMLELGERSDELHATVGEVAAQSGVNMIFSIGRWAHHIGRRAKEMNPLIDARHFARQEEIVPVLAAELRPGDVVLVKGSRGMKMENVVEKLLLLGKR